MNGAPGSAPFAADAQPRRFIVPCPECAAEGHRQKAHWPRTPTSVACPLCDGFGLVPRVVAERYFLAQELAA